MFGRSGGGVRGWLPGLSRSRDLLVLVLQSVKIIGSVSSSSSAGCFFEFNSCLHVNNTMLSSLTFAIYRVYSEIETLYIAL